MPAACIYLGPALILLHQSNEPPASYSEEACQVQHTLRLLSALRRSVGRTHTIVRLQTRIRRKDGTENFGGFVFVLDLV